MKARIRVPYECDTPPCYNIGYVVSSGDIFPYAAAPYQILGVSTYDGEFTTDLLGFYQVPFNHVMGTMTVTDDEENLYVDLSVINDLSLSAVFLYAGPLSGLEPFDVTPQYSSWPFVEYLDGTSNSHTMEIGLDEL